MLSKVSQALSKFVSPVTAIKNSDKTGDEGSKSKDPHAGSDSEPEDKGDSPKKMATSKIPAKPKLELINGGAPEEVPENAQSVESDDSKASSEPETKNETHSPEDQPQQTAAPEPPEPQESVAHSFMTLLNKIRAGDKDKSGWEGIRYYNKARKGGQKKGKLKKGTMLDEAIE